MTKSTQEIGRHGEALALEFLKEKGYTILERNFKNKLGEIDIIAKDKTIVCFVEVKTRTSEQFGLPQEAVLYHKRRQMVKVALSYIKEKKLFGQSARFDVMSVALKENKNDITLIQNAFSLDDA